MPPIIWLNYRELAHGAKHAEAYPSLRDFVGNEPHADEEKIATYLQTAPNYSAMGKIVGDVLSPDVPAVLFPGRNTDGVYCWPLDLAYYVRKYHIRLPEDFLEHMASRGWIPPGEDEIDWKRLGMG